MYSDVQRRLTISMSMFTYFQLKKTAKSFLEIAFLETKPPTTVTALMPTIQIYRQTQTNFMKINTEIYPF